MLNLQFAQKAAHLGELSVRFHDVTAFLDEPLCHASQICHATVLYKLLDSNQSASYDHEENRLIIDEDATASEVTPESEETQLPKQRPLLPYPLRKRWIDWRRDLM